MHWCLETMAMEQTSFTEGTNVNIKCNNSKETVFNIIREKIIKSIESPELLLSKQEDVNLRSNLAYIPFFRNYMNDSLRTNVFVRFQPETIACACIYLAARALQVRINFSSVCYGFYH